MYTDEAILFLRRLSLFLRAGISINAALAFIAEDAGRPAHLRMVRSIAEEVLRGKPLSHALASFPRTFGSLHISLIQVGETSGGLASHLEQAAALSVRRRDERRKLMGAAAYPLCVILATISLTLFLSLYAFPKILPLFKGFNRTLPLSTRLLIHLTDFLTRFGWILALVLIAAGSMGIYALRYPSPRRLRDQLILRIPVLGSMIRHHYAASLTRTLSTLLESGIGILPALALLAQGVRHRLYEEALVEMQKGISAGHPIAESFSEQSSLFPSAVAQLVRAGELTGTLPESLNHAAELYERYFEEQARLLSSLVEPTLMLLMGGLVGFVALAIITPIYGLTQGIAIH